MTSALAVAASEREAKRQTVKARRTRTFFLDMAFFYSEVGLILQRRRYRDAGEMFALSRNRFSGSYVALRRARRA